MPIEWKFALAFALNNKAKVIARWSVQEFLTSNYLEGDIVDSGYMIGKICLTDPLGNEYRPLHSIWKERSAVRAVHKLFSSL